MSLIGKPCKCGSPLACAKVLRLIWRTRQVLLAQNLKAGAQLEHFWGVCTSAREAECAFCSSLIIGISPIEPNAKFPLRVNLKDGVQGHSFERMYKGRKKGVVERQRNAHLNAAVQFC